MTFNISVEREKHEKNDKTFYTYFISANTEDAVVIKHFISSVSRVH